MKTSIILFDINTNSKRHMKPEERMKKKQNTRLFSCWERGEDEAGVLVSLNGNSFWLEEQITFCYLCEWSSLAMCCECAGSQPSSLGLHSFSSWRPSVLRSHAHTALSGWYAWLDPLWFLSSGQYLRVVWRMEEKMKGQSLYSTNAVRARKTEGWEPLL